MGGHGHKPKLPYAIPPPDIYDLNEVPQLKKLQSDLQKKGLKDPWIRNHIWRYPSDKFSYVGRGIASYFKRGFIFGYPLFLATIALERYYEIDYNLLGYDHVSNDERHLPPKHH